MTTDDDLEQLRAAYEQLRTDHAELRRGVVDGYTAMNKALLDATVEVDRLRAAIMRVRALCDDELLTDESDAKLVRAALRGAP